MTAALRFVLGNRLVVAVLTALLATAGLAAAPFDWDLGPLPRDPIPVDAIPDVSEPQQIVFTEWKGRSPEDVEDQLTYPLTVQLLGVPGVRTVRSTSMFGASMINVLMDEDVDFYWSRSRVLEKLASLPPDLLPPDVRPTLGPDATALGQVFWYTLEGRDEDGVVTGGWSQAELRSIQDFFVGPALNSAGGISEVASIGGFVKEYQVDVDPAALLAHDVTLEQVMAAVRASNRDVGARTIEVNQMEYVIRSLGKLRGISDIESVVIKATNQVPVRLVDVARVHAGPAPRRGALDKDGAPAVGGVVVVRYGANPMEAIAGIRAKIEEIAGGLPSKRLDDGRISRVQVVPFYDRTELIEETLGTLETALIDEVLITILVVLLMVWHVRASALIAALLPLAVLFTFVGMWVLEIPANIVALSGIAIAIGTMVDMGIVVTENILRHRDAAPTSPAVEVVQRAVGEIGGAVVTAVLTTVISFLPVFALQAAEGKLFRPLAWTKTLALSSSLLIALVVLPCAAVVLFTRLRDRPIDLGKWRYVPIVVLAVGVTVVLGLHWRPLGFGASGLENVLFAALLVGGLLSITSLFQRAYSRLLRSALGNPLTFSFLPLVIVAFGATVWLGAESTFGWLPQRLTAGLRARFPGLDSEFMPKLDEGSFLYMPSAMPHASFGAVLEATSNIDRAIAALPEVRSAVGKLGRANSALDPAPLSMIETMIDLEPEWRVDEEGERVRVWRDEIRTKDDIWQEIVRVAATPELTSAPELQPIETRIVMLQTGMRSDLGIKVRGPSLDVVQRFAKALEEVVKAVPEVNAESVLADNLIGKPYLEIVPDRLAMARHGLSIERVQRVIEVAVGGKPMTRTIEGRRGYTVRVRYPPELRLTPEDIGATYVATTHGTQVPLREVAEIRYALGPQMIRSEDTFKTAYVTFGADGPRPLSQVVHAVEGAVQGAIDDARVEVPAGVTWKLAGSWQHKVRSDRWLAVLLPVALLLIFLLLYLQFRSVATTTMVFVGVAVAMAGGFTMLWLWSQPWFLDLPFVGERLREVFQVGPQRLSVAVWVGFIALLGIATDDGVVMATYLDQRFREVQPRTAAEINEAVLEAGRRRIRPCLMTTATTVLGLLPVLTHSGRGAEVMLPMAIPAFGGMAIELVTLFVVPLLYAAWHTARLR